MTAAWPAAVNTNWLQQGYSEEPENNVAKFQPDVGPEKLRRRTSLPTKLISYNGLYTSDEWDALLTFYSTTLLDGTQQFTVTHQRTGGNGTWMFTAPPKLNSVDGIIYGAQIALRLISGGTAPPALKFNKSTNSQYLGAL